MPLLTNGTAPAAKAFFYTATVNTSNSWVSVDFTGGSWANSADATIARIDLRLVGAEAGDLLSIAPGSVVSPGAQHLVADHQAGLSLAFVDTPKQTAWTWRTSGAVDVTMVIWYNILPDGYV